MHVCIMILHYSEIRNYKILLLSPNLDFLLCIEVWSINPSLVKNPAAVQGTLVQFLGGEDALGKG